MSGACSASAAIRSRRVEMSSGLGIPVIVPSYGSIIPRPPLPLLGPRGAGSPASSVLRGSSDFLSSIPPPFVSSSDGTALVLVSSLPLPAEHCGPWAWWLVTRIHHPGLQSGDDRTSQVPAGPQCVRALLCRPRWDLGARPLRRFDAAGELGHAAGSHVNPISGLIHTAHTLAVYASRPCHHGLAQDSLLAAGQALPGGAGYPPGP